ncbi:Uncharacterised protein [Mycobacteroides abscessus subsp. abscessus]|uniref:hypothetical protein n=1 Tax=Mycobacteriaceae TaxID=1762 RepID=UPI0006B398FF|nr:MULTISPECIES: hypothetical protein [Mycobacteriaceae]KAB7753620.1 hypothetical protein MMUC44124_24275 [Mycolicibacterium mucogenicum DSM 44124]SLE90171.1 Uncharacterised protein [Mycobacteroides abscessus subsp. abscessus]
MATQTTDLNPTPAALITHTIIRVQGDNTGDLAVHSACTPQARIRIEWGGLLMTMYSADAVQGVLEGFATARSAMMLIPRLAPAASSAAEPFARTTIAIDWTRRPAYAVVPRQELAKNKAREIRWLDLHMGPVTFQIIDQAGCLSATALLRTAHHTATRVFLDGADHADDPTLRTYTPPEPT